MTKPRLNLETARSYGSWLAFLVLPIILNGLVWRGFVVPQKSRLKAWQDAQAVTEVKPKLKALLAESYQLKLDWGKASFAKDYPSVMQILQQSAGRHGVQIQETAMKGQEAQKDLGKQALPLELRVTASFGKLARWMGDLESQYGFRIDSWSVGKPSTGGLPELTLKMTVFTGGA